jgi:uncharacterized delta-60 repeat protein
MKKILLFLILSGFLKADAQVLFVDSLFGTNGVKLIDFSFNEDPVRSILQPDGKILIGGVSNGFNNEHYSAITRFDICGAYDSTFAGDGTLLHSYDFRNIPFDIMLQSDEKIVCAGVGAQSNAGSGQIPFVSRYNNDGTTDTTFGVMGYMPQRFDNVSSGGFFSVKQYSDGRILTTGRSSGNINGGTTGYGAMRFMENGSLDPTFDGDGIARYTQPGSSLREVRGLLLPDKRVLLSFINLAAIESICASMLDSTGALDTVFATSGIYLDTVFTSGEAYPELLPNGNIVIAASFTSNTGLEVVCLSPQGDPVTGFGTNGRYVFPFPVSTGEVRGIRLIDPGHLLVFGKYSVGGGESFILKLDLNGNPDASFGVNGFLNIAAYPGQFHYLKDVIKLDNGQLLGTSYNGSDFIASRYIANSNVPHLTLTNNTDLVTTGGYFLQWLMNGNIIPGEITNTYTPTQNGTYNVLATDSVGCSYLSDPYIMQNVGLSALSGIKMQLINPVSDQLDISVSDAIITGISILDLNGKLVWFKVFHVNRISEKINIAEGLYLLEVNTTMGTVHRKFEKL